MRKRASFTSTQDSTQQDWQIIAAEYATYSEGLANRVMAHLRLLEGDFGGFPVDRYTHSLQTATLALRDGREDEYVVCALLHDIGDTLATSNHADIATAILKPFVSDANLWMVEHHAIFQGYYYFHHLGMDRHMRERFAGHAHYQYTAEFCDMYDSAAFDARSDFLPLSEFEPKIRRLLSVPRRGKT